MCGIDLSLCWQFGNNTVSTINHHINDRSPRESGPKCRSYSKPGTKKREFFCREDVQQEEEVRTSRLHGGRGGILQGTCSVPRRREYGRPQPSIGGPMKREFCDEYAHKERPLAAAAAAVYHVTHRFHADSSSSRTRKTWRSIVPEADGDGVNIGEKGLIWMKSKATNFVCIIWPPWSGGALLAAKEQARFAGKHLLLVSTLQDSQNHTIKTRVL